MKLRTYLLLILLPLVTLPLMLIGWIARDHLTHTVTEQTLGEVNNLLRFTQLDMMTHLNTAKANVDLFSGSQLLQGYLTNEDEESRYGILQMPLLNLFASYAKAYPEYYEIRVLMPDGEEDARYISGSGENATENEADTPYFQHLRNSTEDYFLEFYKNADNGEWAFVVAKKMYLRSAAQDPTQPPTFRGYLVLTLRPDFLVEKIQTTHIGSSGLLLLSDREGNLIFSPEGVSVPPQLPKVAMAQVVEQRKGSRAERLIPTEIFAKHALLHGDHLHDSLYLVALLWEDDLYAKIRPLGWAVVGVTGMVIILLIVLIYVTLKHIFINPIVRFSQAAQRVGSGSFEVRVPSEPVQELASLAKSFNGMVGDLQKMHYNLKESMDKINRQNEELMQLDRMKDDFLANITHEFKTPLNGILGIGTALRGNAYGPLPDIFNKPLTLIQDSAERLLKLTKQILQFTPNGHHVHSVQKRPIGLRAYLERLLEGIAQQAQAKGLGMGCEVGEEVEIVSDPELLDTVFMNLLGNAVKFTLSGYVWVRIHLLTSKAVAICVEDTGIGIPLELHGKIFDRFQQGFRSDSRAFEGSGLGLAIVKQALERLGGVIHLESIPEVGSVFTVVLPLQGEVTPEELLILWREQSALLSTKPPELIPLLKGATRLQEVEDLFPAMVYDDQKPTLLVVDDDAINREVIRSNLSHYGQVLEAQNGQECLEQVQKYDIDLILLDLMMPGISGYEVLVVLQQRSQPPLPVIVLSAKDQKSDITRAFRLGAVDYVTKPFHREELLARIHAQVTLRRNAIEIMERKLSEALLWQEKGMAQAANQAKGEFLANMSHEIRTPMNAILGLSDLALAGELTPTVRDYLNKIITSSHFLRRIIDDILDFSKIEAGQLQMEHVDFYLRDIFEHLADLFRGKAQEQGIELIFSFSQECHLCLVGDGLRLEQILMNLTSNALKFTESGEVEIGVQTVDSFEDKVKLEFFVRDTGIGLTPEQVGRLFQPFVQADSSTTRKYGGTGLGLTICKRLTELMGGQIWVESQKGLGTVFRFTALLQQGVQTAQEKARFPEALRKLYSLVVDDNSVTRKALADMLFSFGISVHMAASGSEALGCVEKWGGEGRGYALILLEEEMAEESGLAIARQIQKKMQEMGYSLAAKMILLTQGQIEPMVHADVERILNKPIICSVLFNTILELFDQSSGKLFHLASSVLDLVAIQKRIGGARVLLVEDNAINRQIAKELMSGIGLVVEVAHHGGEAVRMVDVRSYDVVLMDIQMPVMDGLTATRLIRQIDRFRYLPIVAMTAHAMQGDREKSLAAGMNDHITKPIDKKNFYETLLRWIPFREGVVLEETPIISSDPTGEIPALPGIDIAAGLERMNGNQALFRSLLLELKRDLELVANSLRNFLFGKRQEDMTHALDQIHAIKGASGNLCAMTLYASAQNLEKGVKSGDREVWLPLLDGFEQAMQEVMASVTLLETVQTTKIAEPNLVLTTSVEPLNQKEVRKKLSELFHLLEKNDIQAEACLKFLQHMLQGQGVQVQLDQLQEQVDRFDFEAGLETLTMISKLLNVSFGGEGGD
ncbi:MAG: response regulator [Magnetococcus sp. DMHC-6]